jgi:hypothetical protein
MAVDWAAQNLYWADPNFRWIKMMSISKTEVYDTAIIYTDVDTPSGIAVLPALRLASR